MLSRSESRIGATCAIAGSVLLLVGTYLHPLKADPNEAVAAFAEYAADHLWVASHLMQLAGVAVMVAALLFLTHQLESVRGTGWARLAAGGAIASLAVTTVLQAVDGVALKVMVDAWATAPAAQKEVTFHAAFAVRQVEIGLSQRAEPLIRPHGDRVRGRAVGGQSVSEVDGWPRHRGRRAYNGRRRRDGIYRVFWAGDGDQYVGEFPSPGMDVHSWSMHVAPRRSPPRGTNGLTTACRRRRTASAALPLPAAPDAWH